MKHFVVIAISAFVFATFGAHAQTSDPAPAGWIVARNKPCKIWNPEPQPKESVTWSGACKGGFATGRGVLRWTENGEPDAEFDGEYANGKRNGAGILTTPDGQKTVGNWVDDELVPEDKDAI